MAIEHDLMLDGLPRPWCLLARALRNERERQPLEILWWLRDLIEVAVRLLASVVLAEQLRPITNELRTVELARLVPGLVRQRPSLGTWVQVLDDLARNTQSLPQGGLTSRLAELSQTEPWGVLFRGGDGFVTFRNRTLGHGALASVEASGPSLERFRLAALRFSEHAASLVWNDVRLVQCGDPTGSTAQLAPVVAKFRDDELDLAPLVCAHMTESGARLALFQYAAFRRAEDLRRRCVFLEYESGHQIRDKEQIWPAIVQSSGEPSFDAFIRIEHAESARFNQRAMRMGFLDLQLDAIARTTSDGGRYVLLTGDGGTGKSWFMRQLMRADSHINAGEESLIYSARTVRFRVALGTVSLTDIWSQLAWQARTLELDPPSLDRREPAIDLAAWIRALRERNPQVRRSLVLLAIDGMDEIHDDIEGVLRFARWLVPLKENSIVVISARPSVGRACQYILDSLSDSEGERLLEVRIAPDSAEYVDTQRRYIARRLGLRPHDPSLDTLLQRSGCVFLYTAQLVHGLESGAFEVGAQLPTLEELYGYQLDRLRRVVGHQLFDTVYLRLLLALAVARTPLSAEVLHEAWGLPAPEVLVPVFRDLAECVSSDRSRGGDQMTFRIAHLSLREHLLESHSAAARAVEERFTFAAVDRAARGDIDKPCDVLEDDAALYELLHLSYHAERCGIGRHVSLGSVDSAKLALALCQSDGSSLDVGIRLQCARRAEDGFRHLCQDDDAFQADADAATIALAEALVQIGAPREAIEVIEDRGGVTVLGLGAAVTAAEARFVLGDVAGEQNVLASAAPTTTCGDVSVQVRWMLAHSNFMYRTGRPLEAVDLALQAADVAIGSPLGLQALVWAASNCVYASRNLHAVSILDRAERDFGRWLETSEDLRIEFAQVRGFVGHDLDCNRDVIRWQRLCRDWHHARGNVQRRLLSEVNVADGLWGLGRVQVAVRALDGTLDEARKRNLPQVIDIACLCLANALFDVGTDERVGELYNEGITVASDIGHRWDELYGLIYRARYRGDAHELLAHAHSARELEYRYLESIARAYAAIAACDTTESVELGLSALTTSRESETPGTFAIAWAVLMRAGLLDAVDTYDIVRILGSLQGLKAELRFVKCVVDDAAAHDKRFIGAFSKSLLGV